MCFSQRRTSPIDSVIDSLGDNSHYYCVVVEMPARQSGHRLSIRSYFAVTAQMVSSEHNSNKISG